MNHHRKDMGPASAERRNFLKLSATGGFTAALVAGAAGTLWSDAAVAQTAQEEREREAAADHVMTLATAYVLGASRSYPIMQLDLKENIQNATNGKVYVQAGAGRSAGRRWRAGAGGTGGTIQCAQHSLSNFAPFASDRRPDQPAVFLRLEPALHQPGDQFGRLEGRGRSPRSKARASRRCSTSSSTRALWRCARAATPSSRPADMSGVKFRVPGSKMLQQYYRMVGANPTPVAWGETPSAIKQGVADALDPSVGALYVFGFKDILSHVTFTQAVPDSQVYSMNLEWFKACPATCRKASSSPAN